MKAGFHRLAKRELRDAVDYYNAEESGLGDKFASVVRSAVDDLVKDPGRWPILESRIRRRVLKKFRYVLLYSESGDSILIVAVMHTSRKPTYWKDRID
ncbi:MAG: type II toxin-antitoxin system RelE/ParE family toxin [Pyrinomonadaceae bacterium]